MDNLTRDTAVGYARAAAGGLLVGLPLLMTMEMWWLGFYMSPGKMLLFLAMNFLLLLILEHFSGFRRDVNFWEELQDAIVALGIGLVISAIILFIINRIRWNMPANEILGMIVLQSIPVSIGASVAGSQLGQGGEEQQKEKQNAGFWGSKGIALAGAIFFGFNVAPTEEPMLIGLELQWWHALLLVLLSITQVHAIVYAVEFRGTKPKTKDASKLHHLLNDSASSYAIALVSAAFLLWMFGRIDANTGIVASVHMTIALGYVNSLGAAAARLLL